jgi:GT2 family glycosyltransferase
MTEFPDRPSDFEPVRMAQIDLSAPLPDISMIPVPERVYKRASILVRLHTVPVGQVEIVTDSTVLEPSVYAPVVWRELHPAINQHLRDDNLPKMTNLDNCDLLITDSPSCLRQRRQILDEALFVSVVVCTRDRASLLADCVDSLLALDYPNYEIVIVENAPKTDAVKQLVKDKYGASPIVRYVCEPAPGVAHARNRAVEEARGDILASVDDDVVVDAHWLSSILEGFSAGEQVGMVTGLVLPREIESLPQWWFEGYNSYSRGYQKSIFDIAEHRPKKLFFPYIVGIMGVGASVAYRKSVFTDIGHFDTRFGTGGPLFGAEDEDIFFRVITAGYQVVYQPKAIAYHLASSEYADLQRRAYRYSLAMTAYITKHLLARPWRIITFVAKLPIALVLLMLPASYHNTKRPIGYPAELKKLERKGMLQGPFAYLRCWLARDCCG